MSGEKIKPEQRIAELERALSESKETSARLQEQNTIWEHIFSESYWGMVISNATNGTLLRVNPFYAAMHGYTISEAEGKSVFDMHAPESHAEFEEIIEKIHERGHYAYRTTLMRKDGSRFPAYVESVEVEASDQRLRFVSVWDDSERETRERELGLYRDKLESLVEFRTQELDQANKQLRQEIVAKEEARKKLTEAYQELETVLESMPNGFIAVNDGWKIIYANQNVAQLIRKYEGCDSVVGTNFWETFNLKNQEFRNICLRVMEKRVAERGEIYSGTAKHWFEVNVYPTSYGISLFLTNIDERKKAEKAIEDEHRRLYALLDSFPGMILIQEKDYTIRYANSIFRYTFGDFEGKPCYEVMAGQDSPCKDCTTLAVYRRATPLHEERGFAQRVYESYAYPFQDADGSQLVVKILMDITQRKNSERELARLDRLNMVGEMAAGIAHEVRNPMTTVRGFLQILGAKEDAQQYREFYNIMIEELDRANLIITEFLSLTKEKPSDFVPTDISEIVRTLYPLMAADALHQDKQISVELGEVAPIFGNEKELRQLIMNLARNGLEAMSPGAELFIYTYMERKTVVLQVCDQGGGFDPMVLEKLGTPFLTTKEHGTGLGLVICQSISARHNAIMDFQSNSGGTTVTVTFAAEGGTVERYG